METTIFYSWQSDNSATRRYVEKALKAAVESIGQKPGIEQAPRVDKDTQDVAGAVHIVDTIKNKIDSCGIFLADVSLIDKSSLGRPLVNQNVMFELGYAMGKHSDSRVILVANSDLDDIKELPFDISHHRVIPFSPSKDKKGTRLQASLETAIEIHLQALDRAQRDEASKTVKDRLMDAIQNNKPVKSLSVQYFDSLYTKFNQSSAGRFKNGENREEYAKGMYEAYLSTFPLSVEFNEMIQVAAEYKNNEVLIQAFKRLSIITKYFDITPEDAGHLDHISKEYFTLVVDELVSILLGYIVEEELWDTLLQLSKTKLSRPEGYESHLDIRELQEYPRSVTAYYKKMKGQNYYVPTTHILEEKFGSETNILRKHVEGSLLRYFAYGDHPWSIALVMLRAWSTYMPELPEKFKKPEFIRCLWEIRCLWNKVEHNSWEEFHTDIWNKITSNITDWGMSRHNLVHLFKHYDIETPEQIARL